jgi:hypothetical protein
MSKPPKAAKATKTAAPTDGDKKETELRLRRVVLYKTGLGFFEKRGRIDLSSNKSVKISFKNQNMNDLLKTFSIVRTRGDLMVSGVSYEGENANQAKLLEDSLIKVPDSNTITALIAQLRGTKIQLTVGTTQLQGTLVGLQTRTEPIGSDSPQTIDQTYLLLQTANEGLKTVPLREITRLELHDPTMKNDFQFFLEVIKTARSDKFRNVTIFFEGQQTSEFLLTFIHETPAWKMSYRLFLFDPISPNDKDTSAGDRIMIRVQGWGIIENVLDEDWKNVELTLASGVPISFKYDSYSPLWITRPEVSRGQNLNVTPEPSPPPKPKGRREPEYDSFAGKPADTVATPLDAATRILERSAVKGAGFYYHVPRTVDVKRNQASLIPILEEDIEATLVSVFNLSAHEKFPMATLEFKNMTGMILETGPLSVFKENVFEGEAMLPYLEKEELAKIPYAIDQSLEVHREQKTKTLNIHRITIDYYIYQFYFEEQTTVYTVHSLTSDSKTLILEHPKQTDWKLFDTPDPLESTANFYRFKMEIAPGATKTLIIKEQRELSRYENKNQISLGLIDDWLAKQLINKKQYENLKQRLGLLTRLSEINNELNKIQVARDKINQEQQRLRENMDSLGTLQKEKDLRNRYVSKFERREAELEGMEKTVEKLQKEANEINEKLDK